MSSKTSMKSVVSQRLAE